MGRSTGIKCSCGHPGIKYQRNNDNTVYLHCNGCGWISQTNEQWDPAKHDYIYNQNTVNNSSGNNPAIVFFKVIIGLIGLILLLSMCNSKSNYTPIPATNSLQQQQSKPVKKVKKAHKQVKTETQASRETPKTIESQHDTEVAPPPQQQQAQIQMTRNLNFHIPYALPSGTFLEVWLLENGVETKSYQVAGSYQNYGNINVTLTEDAPANAQYHLKWFAPTPQANQLEETAQRRMMLHQQGFFTGSPPNIQGRRR